MTAVGSVLSVLEQGRYRIRVFGEGEAPDLSTPPELGTFLRLGDTVAGVVTDTRAAPSDLVLFGLDAATRQEVAALAPDLIGPGWVLLDAVGVAFRSGPVWEQGIPRSVPMPGSLVLKMDEAEIRAVHRDPPQVSYLPFLTGDGRPASRAAALVVLSRLASLYPGYERHFHLLSSSVRWGQAFEQGGIR